MADESILRLRIEADTTGLTSGLNKAEGELGQLATETRKVEQQLEETAAAADKAAGKFTQLGDASHMSFGKLSVAFTGATVAGNALLASLDGLTRALAAPVLELLDAEQAAALLQGTFGGLTGEMQRVQDLASQLGANNAFFDDDALAQAAGTLKLFGANADAIQQLLPYVNNLAIAFGVDVADAAQMVGQALQGQTRGLARFVPEVKGANSQLEVLAGMQASAARNAAIAQQRTDGLGGQLALLKRQAADAAQGFGTAMLPAMNAVLGFINANMLPALGKLMGALAGLAAYFKNLGKGYSLADLTRIAGEAILTAESQFNAVRAAVPAVAATRLTGVVGGLALPGTFGGRGGGAAGGGRAAAPRAQGVTMYAEPAGPAMPSRMRYESVAIDADVLKRTTEETLRFREQARKDDEAAAERELRAKERWLKDEADIRDEIARKNDEALQRSAEQAANIFADGVKAAGKFFVDVMNGQATVGGGIRAFGGVASALGMMAGGPVGAALAGVGTEVAATIADQFGKVSAVTAGTKEQLVAERDRLRREAETASSHAFTKYGILGALFGGTQASNQAKALDEAIAKLDKEAADQQVLAAEMQAQAAAEQMKNLYAAREAQQQQVQGMLLQFKSLGERTAAQFGQLSMGPAGTYSATIDIPEAMAILEKMTPEELAKLGAQAREAARTGDFSAIQARFPFLGSVDNLLATMVAVLANLPETQGDKAGTIQAGTSPDRPVYVFDVRPRDQFAFAPESFFFRNRGAGTSRAVAGNVPLAPAQAAPVRGAPPRGRVG